MEYNIYCDESCHLSYDDSDCMVLGAIQCPKFVRKRISDDIRMLKKKHGLSEKFELKWTKVGKKKLEFYYEIIDYILLEQNLKFKCLIFDNKNDLVSTHPTDDEYNLWYYRMYYILLNEFTTPNDHFFIYMDIKDTRGGDRIRTLQNVLCNNIYDFKNEVIRRIQLIRSEEAEILQLVDLLIGAIGYYSRKRELIDLELSQPNELSEAKIKIIQRLKEKTGLNLISSSSVNNNFNILVVRGNFNEIQR